MRSLFDNVPGVGTKTSFTMKFRKAAEQAGFVREWGGRMTLETRRLSEACGGDPTPGYLSRLYKGTPRPGRDVVAKIATALGDAGNDLLVDYEHDSDAERWADPYISKLLSLPKFTNTIVRAPKKWRIETVLAVVKDLLDGRTLADPNGDPIHGTWEEILDEQAKGGPGPRVGGIERFRKTLAVQNPPQKTRR